MKSRTRQATVNQETGIPVIFTGGMTTDESRMQWERIWGNEHLRSCYEWTDWTHPQSIDQYHKIHFDWESNQMNPEFVRSRMGQMVCRDYLRMLDFVFQYYWRESPCWVSYYGYSNVPLFVDLTNYLASHGKYETLRWEPEVIVPTPLAQGLWVLPNAYSAKLIPERPESYEPSEMEFPSRTALHGSDRYWLMHAEPKLPPARWNYWSDVVSRDGDKELLSLHLIRKFKIAMRK
jgi:hypothetical protein